LTEPQNKTIRPQKQNLEVLICVEHRSMRAVLLATLVVSAQAFFASTVGHATVKSRAAAAPTMKHQDFYQRASRAEAGRMRLCIVR
jgi:hypothetical protein